MNNQSITQYLTKLNLDIPDDLFNHDNVKNTSMASRIIDNANNMNWLSNFNKFHYITTAFKVDNGDTNCIYGYVLSEWINDKIQHNYVIFGSTFVSQDGEYRATLYPYTLLSKLFDMYPKIFDLVEKYTADLVESETIKLYCDVSEPTNVNVKESMVNESINRSRLAIKLFMLCFITDYYRLKDNEQPNHMTPNYEDIFKSLPDADSMLSKLLAILVKIPVGSKVLSEKMRLDKLRTYCTSAHSLLSCPKPLSTSLTNLQLGIKLVPLSVSELRNIGSLIYDTWREYYITKTVSGLAINLVCPGVSIVSAWFLLQKIDARFFDGFSMNRKFSHSALTDGIMQSIKETRNMLKVRDSKGNIQQGNKYPTPRFKELATRFMKDANYVNTHIRVSDYTLGIAGDFIGRTFMDIDKMLVMEQYSPIHDMFENLDTFDGLMFSFIYTLFCINSRLTISHNDLHLNNITLFPYIDWSSQLPAADKRGYVFYQLSEDTKFLVPNAGFYIGIIDFSRALIGNVDKVKEMDPELHRQTLKDQRNRYMAIIKKKSPKIMEKYKDQIESLLLSQPLLMFKITSVLDTLDVCLRIRTLLGPIVKKHNKDVTKRLDNMIVESEKLFINAIEQVIKGKLTDPDKIEYPNWTLLTTLFSKYMKSNITKSDLNRLQILDAYNYGNSLEYTLSDEDTLPPWISPIPATVATLLETQDRDMKDDDAKVEIDPVTRVYDNEISNIGNTTSWLV